MNHAPNGLTAAMSGRLWLGGLDGFWGVGHELAAQRVVSLAVDLDGSPSRLAHSFSFLFAYA